MVNKIKWLILYILKYLFIITCRKWEHFYSFLLNRQERKNSFENIEKLNHEYHFWSVKKGYTILDFLKNNGLKESNSFLDYGCGYGRVAIPAINFLNDKKYIGVDLSKERIRMAEEYIAKKNIKKSFQFHVSINKTLDQIIGDKKFDYILLYSVICHNPLKEVERILKELKLHLNINGKIIFDYQNADKDNKNDYFFSLFGYKMKYSYKDYRFSALEMDKLLRKLGYNYKELEDFEKYSDNKYHNPFRKMIMLSHK